LSQGVLPGILKTYVNFSSAPYKTSNRRPYRGRGSYHNSRGGGGGSGGASVFSRLGLPTGSSRNSQDGYIGVPASSSWSKVTVSYY